MNNPNEKQNQTKFSKWHMVNLALDMGYIIAVPLVVLGLLGKYLDGKYSTEPFLTLGGIILAIVLTTVWLTKKFKQYIRDSKN